MPKEIERYRLGQGLEGLKKQAQEGASPLDLLTKAYTTPGLTPEMAQQLQPYLLQAGVQSQNKAAGKADQTPEALGSSTVGAKESNQPKNFGEHQQFRRLGTPEAIATRGQEYNAQNPLLYPTLKSGQEAAQNEYNYQQNAIKGIDAGFKPLLETKLQKGGNATFSSVLGDLENDFKNKAYDDVLRGKLTEKEAINKYTKEALDFAKTKANFDALGFSSLFNAEDTMRSVDAVRKQYQDLGRLEEFNNELISKFNLTDQNASSLTFPLEKNKELNTYINSLPQKIYARSKKATKGKAIDDREVVDQIAKHIGDDDSIFSILKDLESKNYVPTDIMQLISEDWKNGKIRLNERQARELEKPANPRPSLGDLFLFKFAGKKILGE